MKVVVFGGTGLIGKKLIPLLTAAGHEAVAASPSTGVDSVTGEGLAAVLEGAQVVVDVTNSPSWADDDVLAFFTTSSANILAASGPAAHHIAVTIVGAERMPGAGYMRAKVAQEAVIKASGAPYTILRATQFFEFLEGIAAAGTAGDEVRATTALFQPVAADDVAATLFDLIGEPPRNATVELAGPSAAPLSSFVSRWLEARGDDRKVVEDPSVGYFGAEVDDTSLVPAPGANARIGAVTFEKWLG
jgi:uncharacterized protein YbjT (DUF2867 family)